MRIHQYPRIHELSNGRMFLANGELARPIAPMQLPLALEWCNAVWDRSLSLCANSPRWIVRADEPTDSHRPVRRGNATAHYVWFGLEGAWHDTVYSFGGTDRESCQNSSSDTSYADVDRIVDPDGVVDWNNQGNPPDLLHARKFLNGTILMDGSLLAIGGLGQATQIGGGAWECPPVFIPELLRPVEVFGTSPTAWILLNPHAKPRQEHSVALLLPDGRVWVAGGKTTHSYYTYEILEPPYMFAGRAPRINSITSTNWAYSSGAVSHQLNVRCFDDSSPSRAHLIRLGSSTHNFDTGQRLVQLIMTVLTQQPNGSWDFFLDEPSNARFAPPGPYWLAIVDSMGRPTDGRLIMVTK